MMVVLGMFGAVALAVVLAVLLSRRKDAEPGGAKSAGGASARGPEPASADAVRITRRMKSLACPTLLLVPAETAGSSKLGGDPELPSGVSWPEGPGGPLGFLIQLDLAEVRAAGGPDWLPQDGAIYAFYDERWGSADQVRLLHAAAPQGEARLPPPGLKRGLRHGERRIGFAARTSLPSLDWLNEDVREIDVTDEELDEISGLTTADLGDETPHRLGGYPNELQDGRMPIACEYASRGLEPEFDAPVPADIEQASEAWRLLLQIESDSALKMKWPGGGVIYVFIREQDARASDFSRTVTLVQVS